MLDRYPSYAEFAAGADQAVLAEPGSVWSVVALSDGTNAVEVIVYDGAAANNKVIGHAKVSGANQSAQVQSHMVKANTSIHVTVTGTNGKGGIYFSK